MKFEMLPSSERGVSEHGWLRSRHCFSFGSYFHADRISFGTLRVLNEDVISPGRGFPAHEHENMEIVTIVLEGSLEHRDSMNNQGIIRAGDVQRMSAGTGIRHSESNPSAQESVHFLQIWVFPKELGIEPSYEQKSFSEVDQHNRFLPIVTGVKSESAVYIHQDAIFFLGKLEADEELSHTLASKIRGVYLFVIKGEVECLEHVLKTGDAAAIRDVDKISLKARVPSHLLLIEVTVLGTDLLK